MGAHQMPKGKLSIANTEIELSGNSELSNNCHNACELSSVTFAVVPKTQKANLSLHREKWSLKYPYQHFFTQGMISSTTRNEKTGVLLLDPDIYQNTESQ